MDSFGFSYPAANLSIYTPNFTGKCLISYYESEKELQDSRIFIVDANQPFDFNLLGEKVDILQDLPPPGQIFAIDFGDDGLHRAVSSDTVNQTLFFIDCGEIVEDLDLNKFKICSLTERAQNATARAIPCEVTRMTDEHGNEITNIDDLYSIPISFSIHDIQQNKLVVTLRKYTTNDSNESNQINETENPISKWTENEYHQQLYGNEDLTEEQRNQLFEEPDMITTNAMKAIMGHDPQDDKRICPFYDEKTGGCFKGNSCRLMHVPRMMDGWTRDRKETMINLYNNEVPLVGSTVKVCVTSIVDVDEFYVHIPEISARYHPGSLEELKNEINDPEIVKQFKTFVGVPSDNLHHSLVLVKRQGIFYRGKVVDYDEELILFKVYFLDYGCTESIPRKDIFQWYPRWDTVPAQAHRCCLQNVTRIEKNDAKTKEKFRNLILNSDDITAQIIAYTGDLMVKLHDNNGIDIGETLGWLEMVEMKPKIVPSSTELPG